jgi:serine/threonine protein kinase
MVVEYPQAPSADVDRYEFQRKLGSGGSGSVHLVRDRETGEQLALKRLHRADDRGIARLKREFRSLANINHRNVIRLYDLGRAHDGWFLTMEYVDGSDLWSHLGYSTRLVLVRRHVVRGAEQAAANRRTPAGAPVSQGRGGPALHR